MKYDINGIILLDKPSGITSNQVLTKIKKIFSIRKAGYAGTLDALATGLLPIFFGKSTKHANLISNSNKTYRVTAKFNESTDTFDSYGKIVKVRCSSFNEKKLKKSINLFKGKIIQKPPIYSAVKYQGIPLYKYARKGIKIPLKNRTVHIYNIKLMYWDKNILKLSIHCSKGTYIRSIINELGEKLGCGAHVIKLRRTEIVNVPKNKMIKLSYLEKINKEYTSIKHKLQFLKKITLKI